MTSVAPPALQSGIHAASVVYQVIAALGRTGMGETWLAAVSGPPGLERLATITGLWPDLTEGDGVMARFVSDLRSTQRLRHPNLVRIFEVGVDLDAVMANPPVLASTTSPRGFVAREHVAGQPLGRILRRLHGSADFTLQLRLEILVEVLAALEHAHERPDPRAVGAGLWHGDLTPDSVLVGYDGQVKVTDFGLGRALQREGGGTLERLGVTGRLGYAAPEQIRGGACDRRADLFAVGMLLWELVAGRPMFSGRSGLDVLAALAGDAPLPRLPDSPASPAALPRICARALMRDPAARFQSAAEFRRALEDEVIGVLPAESRALGKVIGNAFGAEKKAELALIDRFFQDLPSALDDSDNFTGPIATVSVAPPPPPPPSHPPAAPATVPSYLTDRIMGSVPGVQVGGEAIPDAGNGVPQVGAGRARLALMAGALVLGAAITLALTGPRGRPGEPASAGVVASVAPAATAGEPASDLDPGARARSGGDPRPARGRLSSTPAAASPAVGQVPSALTVLHHPPRPVVPEPSASLPRPASNPGQSTPTPTGTGPVDPENPYRP